MKLTIALAALICGGFLWAMHVAERQAQYRETWAENSSRDELRFTAAGLRGEIFMIVEASPDSVSCDEYLDVFLHASDVSPKLQRQGFTQISCGDETKKLP